MECLSRRLQATASFLIKTISYNAPPMRPTTWQVTVIKTTFAVDCEILCVTGMD